MCLKIHVSLIGSGPLQTWELVGGWVPYTHSTYSVYYILSLGDTTRGP